MQQVAPWALAQTACGCVASRLEGFIT